jgi:hypothetical protein
MLACEGVHKLGEDLVTERKPPGMRFETWIDKQIRDAQERGEFDDLPGKGKPLAGLDEPPDELWWVKSMLQREGLTVTPPSLALRKEVHDLQDRLAPIRDEREVRRVVEDLNARIREVNRKPGDGPPTTVSPLDVDEVVERWRAAATG